MGNVTRLNGHLLALALLVAVSTATAAEQAPDAKDWPMYNYDIVGSRFNRGETAINPSNAAALREKWRFPPPEAGFEIGVIHATPVVVGGEVYFGTATDSAFYKLRPDGTLCWKYRNSRYGNVDTEPRDEARRSARFQSAANGVMGSALVTDDTVYFGDLGGWFYALDRANGEEGWKLNSRSKKFPGSHPLNVFFASPILIEGKLIVAGGTLEQVVSALPFYRGNNGRGFMMALDPKNGDMLWKYDVGPRPEPLDPPITVQDAWGDHVFYFGPGTSSV